MVCRKHRPLAVSSGGLCSADMSIVSLLLLRRTPFSLEKGSILMTLFNLNYHLEGPISRYNNIVDYIFNIYFIVGEGTELML